MKPYILVAVVLAAATGAFAQPQTFERRIERVEVLDGQQLPPPPATDVVHFVSSEFSWNEKPVKNAPYSAEAVTETVQTLADGNRIVRKNTSQIYRDGEGRTRREQTLDAVGPWTSDKPHKTIFINDPVARVNYILEPDGKTARKIILPEQPPEGNVTYGVATGMGAAGAIGPAFGVQAVAAPLPPGRVLIEGHPPVDPPLAGNAQFKNESLGKQILEGVEVEGTRTTITIPAGQIGNDRAIVSVSERWYSPELQTVVMTKRNDPRFGETTYRLTNIQRGEPSPALFAPPPDYTVVDDDVRIHVMQNKGKE